MSTDIEMAEVPTEEVHEELTADVTEEHPAESEVVEVPTEEVHEELTADVTEEHPVESEVVEEVIDTDDGYIVINGVVFNCDGVTRSKKKRLIKLGFKLKNVAAEFQKQLAAKCEIDLRTMPINDEQIDMLIDIGFPGKEHQEALENSSFTEQVTVAFLVLRALLEGAAKN